MKIQKFINVLILFFACGIAVGENLYDGKYQRPTHYPDFEPGNQWPNNMTYAVHAVWPNGDQISNYEIAVYDQDNQLRAVGRSRERDHELCVLTIMGTEGDSFHFEVVYGDFDHPTVKSVTETCVFRTNDIVGIHDAFLLIVEPDRPLDVSDVIRFTRHLNAGEQLPDNNRDGTADSQDRDALIKRILQN